METRALGPSDLHLSLLGLGCNNFGGRIDLAATRKVIDKALELGITHIDTADIYGGRGNSEDFIGECLEGRRDEAVLATKIGKPMSDDPPKNRGSRDYVAAAIEGSLKRLRTDRIDLLYMHEPDPGTPIEETLRALEEAIQAGKVRYLAGSNYSAGEVSDAVDTAKRIGISGFVATQDDYSLLSRDIESVLLPVLETHRLGLIPYYPLAAGALTGKYRRDQPMPEGARLSANEQSANRFFGPARQETVEKLTAFAEERGHTLLELALNWLAQRPQVVSIITGATKPEQLEANVNALGWKLTMEEMAEVDRITKV
ncbi:aldo/keto reductase [Bauldia litoralis]|uniref:aldo/keto reductase n=1 Tax=Bauldia litoralis TaxID=665467 RepID=UPI0032648B2C